MSANLPPNTLQAAQHPFPPFCKCSWHWPPALNTSLGDGYLHVGLFTKQQLICAMCKYRVSMGHWPLARPAPVRTTSKKKNLQPRLKMNSCSMCHCFNPCHTLFAKSQVVARNVSMIQNQVAFLQVSSEEGQDNIHRPETHLSP